MPAFFASWPERYSVIIIAPERDGAIGVATQYTNGDPPTRCVQINRVPFVLCEAGWMDVAGEDETADDADEEFLLVPPEDVLTVLEGLEDASTEEAAAAADGAACGDALEDVAGVYVCELPKGHAGDHRGGLSGGDGSNVGLWAQE